MNKLEFFVNNNGIMQIKQDKSDGNVTVRTFHDWRDFADHSNDMIIPNDDMVMLMNMYRYIKENGIQDSFVNPYGKNEDKGRRSVTCDYESQENKSVTSKVAIDPEKQFNSANLAYRIAECLLDSYQNEEKEKIKTGLFHELSQIGNGYIKSALDAFCLKLNSHKYGMIVTSEDERYPNDACLSFFSEHPEEGLFIRYTEGDTFEDLIGNGADEGMFYQLYYLRTGKRIAYGILTPDSPKEEIEEWNRKYPDK